MPPGSRRRRIPPQADRGDAGGFQPSLFAGAIRRQRRLKLSDVKVRAVAVAVERGRGAEGRNRRSALLLASTARKLIDDGGAEPLGWVGDETPRELGAVFAPPRKWPTSRG